MSATYQPTHAQLRICVQSDPRPSITPSFFLFVRPGVLRFRSDERPNFVALQSANTEIFHAVVMKLLTGRANLDNQFGNGVQRDIGHSSAGAKAIAFDQHSQNCGALLDG
jgi:hypothetical protein